MSDDVESSTSDDPCSCPDYAASSSSRRSFLTKAVAPTGGAVATSLFGDTFRQAA